MISRRAPGYNTCFAKLRSTGRAGILPASGLAVSRETRRQDAGAPKSAHVAPPVLVANGDHGAENVVPRLLLHHHFVGEHAAVPADVQEGLGEVLLFVAQPV